MCDFDAGTDLPTLSGSSSAHQWSQKQQFLAPQKSHAQRSSQSLPLPTGRYEQYLERLIGWIQGQGYSRPMPKAVLLLDRLATQAVVHQPALSWGEQ